jgi:hypothetical protein
VFIRKRALQELIDQRIKQAAVQLQASIDEAFALAVRPRTPVGLSEEERMTLRTVWSAARCSQCGTVHDGTTCPRVKETRFHLNGHPSRIIYWPDGQWKPPPDAITAEDVWPDSKARVPKEDDFNPDNTPEHLKARSDEG